MKKGKTVRSKTTNKPAAKPVKKTAKKPVKPLAAKAEKVSPEVIDKKIYPIGKHKLPDQFSEQVRNKMILEISVLPEHLRGITKKIKKKKLQNTYRDGGWTVEQLIHHLADSHLNAYIRFKLALTENNPTIKPYDENLWAETADVQASSIKDSIRILRGLHKRWAALLENMSKDDWKRTYFHPEYKKAVTLEDALSQYAWHGKHHVAQVQAALKS